MIRGQIAGGVMIDLGASLHEELKFDADGKMLNPSFGKYRFPNIKDAPGKQTVVGVAPAIVNAIQDPIGIDSTKSPSPRRKSWLLWQPRSSQNSEFRIQKVRRPRRGRRAVWLFPTTQF